MAGKRLVRLVTVDDAARLARRRLPRVIADFVTGGAEDEVTVRRNRTAFTDVELRPRYLVDVSQRSMQTTFLGQQLQLPVLLAPTGLARLVHPDGELAAARAASAAGSLLVVSSASSVSIERVAQEVDGPLWFQLYPWGDREVTGALIERAERAGYVGLCVTVDVPAVGGRERDVRNGFTVPPRVTLNNAIDVARHPRWVYGLLHPPRISLANLAELGGTNDVVSLARFVEEHLLNPANNWEELAWIRERWSGPLAIKGIMTGDDARRAVATGVDAIMVSNHGGRQLDGVGASLDALIEIRRAVGEDMPLVLDGGIVRGSDVVKAIALGADVCMIGRAFWYGLACGGEQGVARVLEILATEIDRTLALVGCSDIRDLDPSYVRARG